MTETIAAISTAVAPSGIAIVRVSGDDAIEIADKIYFSKNEKSFHPKREILYIMVG